MVILKYILNLFNKKNTLNVEVKEPGVFYKIYVKKGKIREWRLYDKHHRRIYKIN